MKRKIHCLPLLLSIFLFYPCLAWCQAVKTDSLLQLWKSKNGIEKQKILLSLIKNNDQKIADSLVKITKNNLKNYTDDTELAYVYFNVGMYEKQHAQPDSALTWMKMSEAKALAIKNNELIFNANEQLSDINFQAGKYYEALYYGESMLTNAQKLHNNKNIVISCLSLGSTQQKLLHSDKAFEYLLLAKPLLDNLSSSLNKTESASLKEQFYGLMGTIYLKQKKVKEAKPYLRKALNFALGKPARADRYRQLGMLFNYVDERDSALYFLDKSIALVKDANDAQSLKAAALTYGIFGDLYWANGKYELSKEYIEKELAICRQINNVSLASLSSSNIGQVLITMKRYKEAAEICEKAYAIAPDDDMKREACGCLCQTYNKLEDYKNAYKYAQKYVEANEAIINDEQNKKNILAQSKLEYALKEDSIKTENLIIRQKQDAELKNRNTIGIAMAGGIILLFIILYLAWKRNQLLKASQLQTQKNLEEKEVLLREIHHRVKNNLAVISGLLYLQKNRISDETIKAVLLEGQNRIDSMVLVHEMLYQSNNITSIEVKSYHGKLIQQIAAGFSEQQLTYTINGNIILEPKQAVPVGLILTELITNIYKYAYPAGGSGHFSLDLSTNDTKMTIILADTGRGLPENFDISKSKSLGLKLVQMLTKQMQGSVEFRNDNGTKITLVFEIK